MIRNATTHIVILCSYFLPGSVIRKQLSYATKRGVNIKVITAGISDVPMAKYAERHMYGWLLKNNIELYEYQPGILHGKIAVCDSQWATIGSYNINNISAYASIELNMNVHNTEFAKGVEKTLQQIMDTDCIQITKEWQSRTKSGLTQVIQWLSHELVRFTLFLFTFYFKHKH
jgi:cardiolipin synthase